MLQIKNLYCVRNAGTALERAVLVNLNLTVNKGEMVIIIGGNGAGKSTFFQALTGKMELSSGSIFLDGHDLNQCSLQRRAADIACVLQDPKSGTVSELTVYENLVLASQRGIGFNLARYHCGKQKSDLFEYLCRANIGLERHYDRLVGELSGGQRQSLSVLMAFLQPAKLILLDEITAALDPKSSQRVIALANEMVRANNQSCLMITHDLRQALAYGDRIVVLKNGAFEKEFSGAERDTLTLEGLQDVFEA